MGKYILGDVNNNTIFEIWNEDKCFTIRKEMKDRGRKIYCYVMSVIRERS